MADYSLRNAYVRDKLEAMKASPLLTSFFAAALAVQMSGRILTPNGDGIHDSVAFTLAQPPTNVPRAQVYDVRGRRVRELALVAPTQLRWDGRDSSGRIVGSGVYLVQISEEASLWNGVVAV